MLCKSFMESDFLHMFSPKYSQIFVVLWFSEKQADRTHFSGSKIFLFLPIQTKGICILLLSVNHHHSSSYRAISTDIPDPLSPHFPIVYYFRQILRATSRMGTDLLYVDSSWTFCLCSSMGRGPQEHLNHEIVLASPTVSRVSASSNFDSFR